MLPPFIIEQIREREEKEKAKRDRPQPRLELPLDLPHRRRAPENAEDDPDRGVVVVDLGS